MQFDVIIGNPPYQLDTRGAGRQAVPIYNKFVQQAKKLNPRYLCMIIPSRWFAGGMGLDAFRNEMLGDTRIKKLVDYPNAKDCFPNVSISGGVCYFLWDRDYNGLCSFQSRHNGKVTEKKRTLNEFKYLVRLNEAIDIIEKVRSHDEPSLEGIVGPIGPFGFPTFARGKPAKTDSALKLFHSKGQGFVEPEEVLKGKERINKFKIMVSKTIAEHAGEPSKDGRFKVFSMVRVLKPGEVCTFSYIVLGSFDCEDEAQNLRSYLRTKFARFLVLQAVSSINLTKDKMSHQSKLNREEKSNERYDTKQHEILPKLWGNLNYAILYLENKAGLLDKESIEYRRYKELKNTKEDPVAVFYGQFDDNRIALNEKIKDVFDQARKSIEEIWAELNKGNDVQILIEEIKQYRTKQEKLIYKVLFPHQSYDDTHLLENSNRNQKGLGTQNDQPQSTLQNIAKSQDKPDMRRKDDNQNEEHEAHKYQKAADQGNANAQHNLGILYQNGWGVDQDHMQASDWYQKAVDQGNAYAQGNLGFLYERGWGVDQDYAQSVRWYQKAANQGNAYAQGNLGFLYDRGWGVDQDYAQAAHWYQKAADQGDAYAQNNLGFLYERGWGVDQDYGQAVHWYQKAAGQGSAYAQNCLGVLYYHGQGVDQDYEQSFCWFQKAVDQGDANAQDNLGVLYRDGQGVDQDYAQAAHWFQKAAGQGDADVQNNLGILYKSGKGVPKDHVQAYMWLNLAAAKGNKDAEKARDDLAKSISKKAVEEAQRLSREWLANHKKPE